MWGCLLKEQDTKNLGNWTFWEQGQNLLNGGFLYNDLAELYKDESNYEYLYLFFIYWVDHFPQRWIFQISFLGKVCLASSTPAAELGKETDVLSVQ